MRAGTASTSQKGGRTHGLTAAIEKWQQGQALQAEAIRDMVEAAADDKPERYLSSTQLCELIGYSENTIRNMVSAHALVEGTHFVKKRGRLLFIWSAIEAWLREDAAEYGDEQKRGR